jgi:hypothetical protein
MYVSAIFICKVFLLERVDEQSATLIRRELAAVGVWFSWLIGGLKVFGSQEGQRCSLS